MKIGDKGNGLAGLGMAGGMGGLAGPQMDRVFDAAVQGDRSAVESAKQARGKVDAVRTEVNSFAGMLQELGSVSDGLKLPGSFNKMKAESSNPEILESAVTGLVKEGTYNFEVRGLATTDKHLAVGFPDADQTEVGFGHIGVGVGDAGMKDITINPGATLKDVAATINAAGAGVQARVIDTGLGDDPFRLHVVSEKTGEAARIALDPDTTFLDFQNSTVGKNLNMKFEDVDISRAGNDVKDLVDGLAFNVKRAEPGTQVTVSVRPDVDATFKGIQDFVDKYNKVASYANGQFQLAPRGGEGDRGSLGPLADGTTRQVMRSLQSQLSSPLATGGPFETLAQIGITTNPKNGELALNADKVKEALAGNYDGVRAVFASGENGPGIAEKLSRAVKSLSDPVSGSVKLRQTTLSKQIQMQDKSIDNKVRQLEAKEQQVKQSLNSMQSHMTKLDAQQSFINARMNNGGAGGQQSA